MNILVTGAKGFVGKNLCENLKAIRDGKKRDRPGLHINSIYEYDINSTPKELDEYCADCDFVFNLAGVNRPKDVSEFKASNFGFANELLETLRAHHNISPVMLSSSVQASLAGRFGASEYGLSKRDGEELFFKYNIDTGAKVLVYRFPNLFGKWCKPNYNSAVATFCNAVANDEEYTVNDRTTEIESLFIDDLLTEFFDALEGKEHHCEYPKTGEIVDGVKYDGLTPLPISSGRYCYVPITHKVTLGRIVDLLEEFKAQPETFLFTSIPEGSFEKKLYSTYLSYLPEEKTIFDLHGSVDNRGSFTEFFKNADVGQFSINVSKPGMTKGQHWHNGKMEIFLVVSGEGLVQERRIGLDEDGKPYPVREYRVSGNKLQCVYMLPGYTHNIINTSADRDLITVMWANEIFDNEHPETYHEDVVVDGARIESIEGD